MNHKKSGIILANSAYAKIYSYERAQKKLELIKELSHPRATLKVHDLMADAAGRYQKSADPNQGTYEPHTDPKEVEAIKFAGELSEFLEHFLPPVSEIIVIAPGKFQGHLKQKMKETVSEKVHQFVDKDYTKLGIKDLEKHLTEVLDLKFK